VCPCKCVFCNRHQSQLREIYKPAFYHPLVLNVTGGEPFMRSTLEYDIDLINPLFVSISTTGYNPKHILKICRAINKWHFLSISISIDGFARTHNKLRRTNIYNKAMTTYHALKKEGIRTSIQYTLSPENIGEAEKFIESFPDTTFNMPVFAGFYNNLFDKVKVNLPKDRLLSLFKAQNKGYKKYYYSHLIQTLSGQRKHPCLFKEGKAVYYDLDNFPWRCHIPFHDCNTCTQMCDSILHPIYHPFKVMGFLWKS
jgi:hypothetical protein